MIAWQEVKYVVRPPSIPDGVVVVNKEASTPMPSFAASGPRRRKWFSRSLAIGGLTFLGYLLGAAVMFFQLPSSEFLDKAFLGAHAWNERRQASTPSPLHKTQRATVGKIDYPGKTYDGFTLYTCASLTIPSTQAFLINMRGEVVHQWAIPFSKVWPRPSHIRGRVNDPLTCFFDCHLYPNGDLLVVFHGMEHWVNGYGLAKLDKDSNLLWKYSGNIHHDVEVGEDGTIYAIAHKVANSLPQGLAFVPAPCLVDELVFLSPEGNPLREPIPLLEAFGDSSYNPLLDSLRRDSGRDLPMRLNLPRFLEETHNRRREPLHLNCVRVLNRRLAAQFPTFQAGHLLLSLRNLDTIAMLDPQKKAVVWAARGPWRAQHDAQFLENGHLLIFDNLGTPRGSRVLEYDPQTQALPWSYPQSEDPSFFTSERGMCQRLPNGNTLIVNSEPGEIFEVTPQRETVWSCFTDRFITSARRYGPEQLHFLTGGTHARP